MNKTACGNDRLTGQMSKRHDAPSGFMTRTVMKTAQKVLTAILVTQKCEAIIRTYRSQRDAYAPVMLAAAAMLLRKT